MRPIPASVALRWGPMWRGAYIAARPWWRIAHVGARIVEAVRMDGAQAHAALCGADPSAPENALLDLSELESIDQRHPVPAPLPMVGQVWVIDGTEATIAYVDASSWRDGLATGWTVGLGGRTCYVGPDWADPWPIVGAFLVAGPTPWGRDVPWSSPSQRDEDERKDSEAYARNMSKVWEGLAKP